MRQYCLSYHVAEQTFRWLYIFRSNTYPNFDLCWHWRRRTRQTVGIENDIGIKDRDRSSNKKSIQLPIITTTKSTPVTSDQIQIPIMIIITDCSKTRLEEEISPNAPPIKIINLSQRKNKNQKYLIMMSSYALNLNTKNITNKKLVAIQFFLWVCDNNWPLTVNNERQGTECKWRDCLNVVYWETKLFLGSFRTRYISN